MKKIALITGVNGQDGSYLAELLLNKGYEVHGTKRRSSLRNTNRIDHLNSNKSGTDIDNKIFLHHADVTDASSINRIIDAVSPNEIYNLAAQSHVAVSFEEPEYTADTCALGCLRILEAIKRSGKDIRFYQASTSEIFGGQDHSILNEDSLINPRSPYAAAKAYAYYITKQYRESYNLFASNGILFNHESPRRGENFVTQKVVLGVKKINEGKQEYILMGNINATRDWGHADDYVYAMYLIMNAEQPDDFVVATSNSYSVRDFIQRCFIHVGVEIEFKGSGLEEIAVVTKINDHNLNIKIGQIVVKISKSFFRPLEVDDLKGDYTKINSKLGWSPKKNIDDLISDMFTQSII